MKIKVNPLNLNSIQSAIDKIGETKKAVNSIPRAVMQELVDRGAEWARQQCPYKSGETYDSIVGYVSEDGRGHIVAGGNAAWVEFGTGVKGAGEPYPGDKSFMKNATRYNDYLSGEKIKVAEDGHLYWRYFDEHLNKFVTTDGHASNPFMWETAMYIRSIVPDVIKMKFRHTPYEMRQ